jgi:hypothetical protein
VPLEGLDHVAAVLNAFEGDPLRGGALTPLSPDARMMFWIRQIGGAEGPFPEAIRGLFERALGSAALASLRRCETCESWMAARYANRRRCGPKCHAKVWSRAHRAARRRQRRRAMRLAGASPVSPPATRVEPASVPRNVPASTRIQPKPGQRQPTAKRKTLR